MGAERWTAPVVASPGPSVGEMKQFVREDFQAFVNDKDLTQADRSLLEDFPGHYESAGVNVGIEAAKTVMHQEHLRRPDLHVEVKDIPAEGERVMVRNVWTGTEARTQQRIEFHSSVLWRFANGNTAERWTTITPPKEVPPSGAYGHE